MKASDNIDKLKLGDLVNFITKDYSACLTEIKVDSNGSSFSIKGGRKNFIPPVMVVSEIARLEPHNAKLFDQETGKKVKDTVQVKCTWYASIGGKEQIFYKWFNRSVLEPVKSIKSEKKREFGLNEIVTLRTFLAVEAEMKAAIKIKRTTNNSQGIEYKYEVNTSYFFPPKMVITQLGKRNNENKLFSEKTGDLVKISTFREIKCMWFDPSSGKYSENYFPEEVLTKVVENKSYAQLMEDFLDSPDFSSPNSTPQDSTDTNDVDKHFFLDKD